MVDAMELGRVVGRSSFRPTQSAAVRNNNARHRERRLRSRFQTVPPDGVLIYICCVDSLTNRGFAIIVLFLARWLGSSVIVVHPPTLTIYYRFYCY